MTSRMADVAAPAILSFAVFVLQPLAVLGPNASEFGVGKLALLWPFLVLFVIGTIIGTLVSWACGFARALLLLWLSGAVCVLIVSQIFAQPGTFLVDGAIHEYHPPFLSAAAELVALAAVCALAFAARRLIYANRGFVTVVVAAWAAAAAAAPALSYLSYEKAPGSLDVLAQLSPRLNVLHLMFDSLQADAFAEVLARQPALADELDGFVFYDEHTGYSNWTSFSIPAMLTGHLYFHEHDAGNESAYDLVRRWMTEDSLPTRLRQRGFAVSTMQPGKFFCEGAQFSCTTLHENTEVSDHLEAKRGIISGAHAFVADLALLRMAPTILKGPIYNRGRFHFARRSGNLEDLTPIQNILLSRDVAYYLSASFNVSEVAPTYKFIHFYPPHKPFVLDGSCEFRAENAEAETWDNYIGQAECSVRLLVALLRKLKELGAYDNTVVILQADTGLGMTPDRGVARKEEVASKLGGYTASQLVAYARPVFAMKQLGEHGRLRASHAPTHHRDTVSLVLSAIARRPADVEISAVPRPFVVSDALRPEMRRVHPFELYEVSGSAGDFAHWSPMGTFSAPGVLATAAQPIERLSVDIAPQGELSVGDRTTISAKVSGGEPDQLYLFFYRVEEGKFGVIQNWSDKSAAEWTVVEGQRNPCIVELLVAARNQGSEERTSKTTEVTLPIKGRKCSAPGVWMMRPIEGITVDVLPDSQLSVGDKINLSATVSGGEADPLYLFFYRIEDGRFGLIQNWSHQNNAEWIVTEGQRNPCIVELLVAARNDGSDEKTSKTVELDLPVAGPTCPKKRGE